MDIGRPIAETELKVQDAGAQLRLAMQHADDEDVFRSCVNAFVAAARSVTFVMEAESAKRPELLAWYKEQTADLGSAPLFRFFNAQRVYSIHQGVVRATRKSYPVESVRITHAPEAAAGETVVVDLDLSLDSEFQVRDIIHVRPGGIAFAWYFDRTDDLTGPTTNVLALCGVYFRVLRELVDCWVPRWVRLTTESGQAASCTQP